YYFTQKYTLLPIEMTPTRAIFVFGLTLLMSLIAGATAINKLQYVDPADIF
ncbi:MAG: ABC transporter, partial [Microcystis sp. M53599_WE4]|nr:ABC transporter [Microcystis sp. M53599_WE4]